MFIYLTNLLSANSYVSVLLHLVNSPNKEFGAPALDSPKPMR